MEAVNTPLTLDKSITHQASRIRSAIRTKLPEDTKSIRDGNGRIDAPESVPVAGDR